MKEIEARSQNEIVSRESYLVCIVTRLASLPVRKGIARLIFSFSVISYWFSISRGVLLYARLTNDWLTNP